MFRILFLICMCMTNHAFAMNLERPSIDQKDENELLLWGQYDTFDARFDVIGYSNKFNPKAAKLNYLDTARLGIIYAPETNIQLAYSLNINQQHTLRSTAPTSIKSNSTGHQFRGQWQFYEKTTPTKSIHFAVEIGYQQHQAQKIDFYEYRFKNITVTWPGHVLFSLQANDRAYLTAIRVKYIQRRWKLHAGLELRYVGVSASMLSDSATITNALASQAPQANPWHETHAILQFSADYYINSKWQIAADFQHYQINRLQYIPRKNQKDYNDNDTLDLYLFWKVTKSITPYVHSHISRRFTLGTMPLNYNQRSSSKFKYPFGYLSIGAQYTF